MTYVAFVETSSASRAGVHSYVPQDGYDKLSRIHRSILRTIVGPAACPASAQLVSIHALHPWQNLVRRDSRRSCFFQVLSCKSSCRVLSIVLLTHQPLRSGLDSKAFSVRFGISRPRTVHNGLIYVSQELRRRCQGGRAVAKLYDCNRRCFVCPP